MEIKRTALNQIHSKLISNKVILLLGSRRVEKTFLLNQIKDETNEKLLFWNGEDIAVQELLKRRTVQNYSNLIES
ncbi:MAG: hypothetical protein JEY94_03815 [Melioribacteraceae bacterium]|nr:hypothetical protein [Melioribacteraceae bacterium]